MTMTPEQADARRYNRRTRAIEEQAAALNRIARALDTRNIIETANMSPVSTSGNTSRSWTNDRAKELMSWITHRINAAAMRP